MTRPQTSKRNENGRVQSYHGDGSQGLDMTVSSRQQRDQKDMKNASHVKIGFKKWQLAHGDVHRRIRRRICPGGPIIVKNGQVVEVAEIESPNRIYGERADPYACLSRSTKGQIEAHTVVVNWLVRVELQTKSGGVILYKGER